MPATRRSRTFGGPAAKGAQSTLSFSGGRRVTKAIPPAPKQSKENTESIKVEAIVTDLEAPGVLEDESSPVLSEAASPKQAQTILNKPNTEEEELAKKVTDAQIKKYWRSREAERKTLRVHQEDLCIEEKILRLFDVSSQYGPCIGIARMKRWVRAKKLGLDPPIEVLAVLLKEEGKGDAKNERAHIDELMSSKPILG